MPLVAGNLPLSASNLVTFSDAHMPATLCRALHCASVYFTKL